MLSYTVCQDNITLTTTLFLTGTYPSRQLYRDIEVLREKAAIYNSSISEDTSSGFVMLTLGPHPNSARVYVHRFILESRCPVLFTACSTATVTTDVCSITDIYSKYLEHNNAELTTTTENKTHNVNSKLLIGFVLFGSNVSTGLKGDDSETEFADFAKKFVNFHSASSVPVPDSNTQKHSQNLVCVLNILLDYLYIGCLHQSNYSNNNGTTGEALIIAYARVYAIATILELGQLSHLVDIALSK